LFFQRGAGLVAGAVCGLAAGMEGVEGVDWVTSVDGVTLAARLLAAEVVGFTSDCGFCIELALVAGLLSAGLAGLVGALSSLGILPPQW